MVNHILNGGWATDFGESASATVDRAGRVLLPFLTQGENLLFRLDGGFEKAEGTAKINSTALESGADIRGFHDFWIAGTSGSPAQHRVLHVNTVVMKDDGDGSFTNINTGLEDDKIPSYAVLNDLLVYTSDSNTDVPQSWDGTTNQNLAGTPPNFAFHVEHKGRIWAAGIAAKPSTVAYSALNNPEDWVGAGSGEIPISTDDGDRITGLASHNGELIVFKGPYIGSIHRIQGSAPTGDDPFRRTTHSTGVACAGHNSITKIKGNDLAFVTNNGSFRSLEATARFGDYEAAALSLPINSWLRTHANFSQLSRAWGVTEPNGNYSLWTLPVDGGTTNTAMLMLDHRFPEPRWSNWSSYSLASLGISINSSNNDNPTLVAGGNDGFLYNMQQANRTVQPDGSVAARLKTPTLDYGDPFRMKTICGSALRITPVSGSDIRFSWMRDGQGTQTTTFAQSGGGTLLDEFLLDTDSLSILAATYTYDEMEEGGDFHTISYSLENETISHNIQFHSLGVALEMDAISMESS